MHAALACGLLMQRRLSPQEHAELVARQEAEIGALMEERITMERSIAEASSQQTAANAAALQVLRARCIEECNALVAELEAKQKELEQRLTAIQSEHILAADSLRIQERALADKDAENSNIAQQLKRKIAKERFALQASKDKWSAEEKALREEQTRLASDHSRGSLQFRLLDAKHEVLKTADVRRREEIDVTDTEMLGELGTSCADAVLRLHEFARVPVDGVAPSEELLSDIAAAITDLTCNADTAAASESAMRLLESLNAAINSQRNVLDTRAAIISEMTTLRKVLASR